MKKYDLDEFTEDIKENSRLGSNIAAVAQYYQVIQLNNIANELALIAQLLKK